MVHQRLAKPRKKLSELIHSELYSTIVSFNLATDATLNKSVWFERADAS
jgi:hypothetical protein